MSTPLDYAEFYFDHVDKGESMKAPEGVAAPLEPTQCPSCTGSKEMALCAHVFHSPAGVRQTGDFPMGAVASEPTKLTPEQYLKEWDAFAEVGARRPFSYFMQFAEAYAAAVSKNLQEELARLKNIEKVAKVSKQFLYAEGHCCGDAHQLLESHRRHMQLLGIQEVRKEDEHCVEITLHNRRAEAAESHISELEKKIAALGRDTGGKL